MTARPSSPLAALALGLALPALAAGGAISLSGCGDAKVEPAGAPETPVDRVRRENLERQGLADGISLFDFGGGDDDRRASGGMAVSRHLWHASLEVLSFLPLDSVDAEGGVIITEWAALPEAPGEQMKVVARVHAQELQTDGVRVRIFRREEGDDGTPRDVSVDPSTERALEDRILTRARELYVADTG